ncbi:hypothetical protein BZARG_3002 [Bizionia argentinensis JUB59]|uniref:Adhesin domain-containing protein n=1 Tax=Bizionia argentinensis JUB59 TaxID=1046627 RepID=G2EFL2_9FLAO|nr:hypothetical protein [Bizionia argentinensis]EGV42791.1 hypothetical protein BZARG_3002 [Bizionia argentinensis JUB59]
MKTHILYKLCLAFILFPMLISANTNPVNHDKHKQEKTIKKSFNVSKNATLKIDNSYGNLDIITWNENRIEIEIKISVSGSNEDKVLEKIDDITVDFESNSSYVSAKTIFNKSKSRSWWNWGSNNNINMKINYIIKMPITNSVDLSNDYGSINLDKLEGDAKINCDYGKITTKELMGNNNIIEFDYTKNSYFEFINNGRIKADYSGFVVANAKNINLEAEYTNSKFETIEDLKYKCDYGALTVDRANNVSGSGDYLTIVLGDIYKNVKIDADYGSIKIKSIKESASTIEIDSDYVGIHIGFNSYYHFNFDIDLDYASLRNHDEFQFNKKREESTSKYYQGYYGSSSTNNLIKINSDYGSVSIEKN